MSDTRTRTGHAHLYRCRSPKSGRKYWTAISDDGYHRFVGATKNQALKKLRLVYDFVAYSRHTGTHKPSEVAAEALRMTEAYQERRKGDG